MTQSKKTQKALLTSLLSLLVCVALLIGSTFAWFTDSVTSGRNQIIAEQSGRGAGIHHGLRYLNSVEGQTDLFRQDTLWEPGHTEVVYLRLRNAGTLALDYKLLVYAAAETAGWSVEEREFKAVRGIEICAQGAGRSADRRYDARGRQGGRRRLL